MSGFLDRLWATFGRNGKLANPPNLDKPRPAPAEARFQACIAEVLRHEGGYVNDPQDPGGETNFGISKRSYPDVDIKRLTEDQARAIYRRDYWPKVSGDQLPAGVDLAMFDYGVNSGPGTAIRDLQRCLGVAVDGVIGPRTLEAVGKMPPVDLVAALCNRRLARLAGLPGWSRFGKGWGRRVAEVRIKAQEMAQ